MRTTITIDDELWQLAKDDTGISEGSELVRRALRDLVAQQAMRRLIALGGKMPGFSVPGHGPDDHD